jgi:hypothetical protein
MWMRIGITAAAIAAIAAASYLEFGLDIRTPRSRDFMAGVVGTNVRIPPARYNAVAAAMKAKYGPDARTWVSAHGTTTRLYGHVVASEELPFRFFEAVGLTLVGKTPGTVSTFPFRISPERLPRRVEENFLATTISVRFQRVLKPRVLDFRNNDYLIAPCWNFSAAELNLPVASRLLSLGRTTLCMVMWKHVPITRMLVGVTIADGGAWIRPFARGACRVLAYAWLEKARAMAGAERPDYLQCMLADRPQSREHSVSTLVYELRQDDTLALIQ